MRTITVQQRRRAMVRHHHLAGDARNPEAATEAVVALHATDPASVFPSVLAAARCPRSGSAKPLQPEYSLQAAAAFGATALRSPDHNSPNRAT